MDNPNTPPDFEASNVRTVVLPTYIDPEKGTQSFSIDLRPWIVIQDMFIEKQIMYITSWLNTIGAWIIRSEMATEIIRERRIKYYRQKNGESFYHNERHCLPLDHDFCAWEAQTRWLKNASRNLGRVADNLRSMYATQRVQMAPGNQPK